MNQTTSENLRVFQETLLDRMGFQLFSTFKFGEHQIRFTTKCGAKVVLANGESDGEVAFVVLTKMDRILEMITCDISTSSKMADAQLDVMALIAKHRRNRFGKGIK